jgi:DNA-binding response OmpR family regulator
MLFLFGPRMSTARYARAALSHPHPGDDELAVVAVLSDDARYRAAMAEQLRGEGFSVLDGPASLATLRRLPYWGSGWQQPNYLRLVVLDLTRGNASSRQGADLQLVDAVRRQDWAVPIILLVPSMGGDRSVEGRSFGANVVFEGQVDAGELTAAALRLSAARREV